MTCVSCKYQWCWLCEGEYKYGHYDSGRCKDQWFAIADYPKKLKIIIIIIIDLIGIIDIIEIVILEYIEFSDVFIQLILFHMI